MTELGRLAEAEGLDLSTLLARTSRFGHGTTIGTSAVLERAGARVAWSRRPAIHAGFV